MWKSAVPLCLLTAVCSAVPSGGFRRLRARPGGRIVGGGDVDISQYPWQVSLQLLHLHHCGGSILNTQWVLTVAHCLYEHSVGELTVRAGTSTRESGGNVYPIIEKVSHGLWHYYSHDYDIAVFAIPGLFIFTSNMQTVSLGSTEPAAGTQVTITGWGDDDTQLQAVTTTIVSRDSCNESYGGNFTKRMICAGEGEGGKGACQGDSGGPLVAGSTQYGIVSWGNECAATGYPGVYTNVAYLRKWINKETGA